MRRLLTFLTPLMAVALLCATASAAPLRWSSGRQIDRSAGVSLGTLVCPSATETFRIIDGDGQVKN